MIRTVLVLTLAVAPLATFVGVQSGARTSVQSDPEIRPSVGLLPFVAAVGTTRHRASRDVPDR
jgi:hypothetical protein